MIAVESVLALWRRGLAAVLLVVIGLVLAGCAGGSRPFGKGDGTSGPTGKTVPPIVLQTMEGLPAGRMQAFRDALSIAAGQRDMAIVEGSFQSSELILNGRFTAAAEGGGVRVEYRWTLTDPSGATVHDFAGQEVASGTAGSDLWSAVTPAVLQRIAEVTSLNLATRLAQLGYATRTAARDLPPSEYFVAAGPDAYKDIDFETLKGPGAVEAAAAPADEPLPLPAETAVAETQAEGNAITAVAVVAVKGSPGTGDGELTAAMRRTLAKAGWPVLEAPRADALTIAGEVRLEKPQGASQQVALRWTVSTPDGRSLGDIKQANSVPAGSLDHGWGDNAVPVAEAAATGIFDLIETYR
ncbi:MAG: hypothetical protein ACT4SY_11885 [Hyphomicrobiales bacterium]